VILGFAASPWQQQQQQLDYNSITAAEKWCFEFGFRSWEEQLVCELGFMA
jgi:hypothetical protein